MISILLAVLGLPLALVAGTYAAFNYRVFGRLPRGRRYQRILNSPQYDRVQKRFRNERDRDFRKDFQFQSLLKEYIRGQQIRSPKAPLPSRTIEWDAIFDRKCKEVRCVWLGHSTVLLNIFGTVLLIDPVLAESASPVSFITKRFQPSLVPAERLTDVDVVLISHDHYDHLDHQTIRKLSRGRAKFITALGVGERLEGFGVSSQSLIELDWWETAKVGGLEWTCTPAQHFSGRGLHDHGKTLWAGWHFVGTLGEDRRAIYFTGDTGYSTHFLEIARRLGPVDFALIECGQYNTMWEYVHMLPEQAAQAAKDLNATVFMPVHWGMFNLSLHDWFEPVERVHAAAESKRLRILTPILGQCFIVPKTTSNIDNDLTQTWWRDHIDYSTK